MQRLILTFVLVTSIIAVALPLSTGLNSDSTQIDLFHAGSKNVLEVPADGTLFNPNPSDFLIDSVCIGSNVPLCAFGGEDGTWIGAISNTNNGCVEISPPLVINNAFCCISLDDCALLDQPFLLARADNSSTFNSTTVKVFGDKSYELSVENDGYQVYFNHDAALIDRVCMLNMTTESCGFSARDGTWIQVYNVTDNGCAPVSPPTALNAVACCHTMNLCPALNDPFALQARDTVDVAISATKITLTSNGYDAEAMTVPADGTTFFFDAAHDQILRVCLDHHSMNCIFKATDGTAYAASTSSGGGCIEMDSAKILHQGFCCEDFASCPGLKNTQSRRSVLDHTDDTLQARRVNGPVVNNILPLMFEGAPDLVGWEYVLTNAQGFWVSDAIPWGVGQVCTMNDHAICAFVGLDGTVTAVVGGRNSNCGVVAPPQVLIDGLCCASRSQCNVSDHSRLVGLVGDETMASWMGAVASSSATVASSSTNTAVFGSTLTLAARAADIQDVTIEYYGATSDNYGFELVTGDYSAFVPSVSRGVDQVCIISPQGFCGFWSADETLGFEVGPVADGQSSACYTVGGAYVLAGGICCRSSDGCFSARRSIKALSIRDSTTSDDTAPNREITFYGDPAFYVEAGGVTTTLRLVADGHFEPLPAMGQPVVEVCLDGGKCQFYVGGGLGLGPSILTGYGGCLSFEPSITLTGVACN